jgi:hypothetical protein
VKTLDDFAPGAAPTRRRAKAKPEWRPPTLADLFVCRVLAFDPSLSSTGFVDMEFTGTELFVHHGETFTGQIPPNLTGWAKDFHAAEDLRRQFYDRLSRYQGVDVSVAHEAPPLGGGKLASPESAVQASLMLRVAAHDLGMAVLPMVRTQDHKRLTVNQANAKKQDYHRLLKPLLEELSPGCLSIITNEHQRDAAGVGLAVMLRGRVDR